MVKDEGGGGGGVKGQIQKLSVFRLIKKADAIL